MRLTGSFQTMTTHGRSCSTPSSDVGWRISTSAGATIVLIAELLRTSGRATAGEASDLQGALVPGRISRADAHDRGARGKSEAEARRTGVKTFPVDRTAEPQALRGRAAIGRGETELGLSLPARDDACRLRRAVIVDPPAPLLRRGV